MEILVLLAGVALIALAILDALMTTLSATKRAGPVTRITTAAVWRTALAVHRRTPGHGLLTSTGPVLLVLSLAIWMTLLWAGWTLIFGSYEGVVVISTDRVPADWVDRIYFAGMSLISLGTGDLVAASPWWRVLSVVATVTGLFLLTLALSYFVSVISAVTERRSIAAQLLALGGTPQEMLLRAWDGEQISSSLGSTLTGMGSQLSKLAEQHLTYHVLHHFHAKDSRRATLVAVARLDEALTLLEYGVAAEHRPDPFVMRQMRAHIDRLAEVVEAVNVTGTDAQVPMAPDRTVLALAGIPLAAEEEFDEAVRRLAPRRQQMQALVHGAGWSWEDVGTPGQSG